LLKPLLYRFLQPLKVDTSPCWQLRRRCPKVGDPFALPLLIELHKCVLHDHLHFSVSVASALIIALNVTAALFTVTASPPGACLARAGTLLAALSSGVLLRAGVLPAGAGLLATGLFTVPPGRLIRLTGSLLGPTGVLGATMGHLWGHTGSRPRPTGVSPVLCWACFDAVAAKRMSVASLSMSTMSSLGLSGLPRSMSSM
jgi:hypothetical protein